MIAPLVGGVGDLLCEERELALSKSCAILTLCNTNPVLSDESSSKPIVMDF